MKLATIRDGTRDGTLVVVSADLSRALPARGIAPSLLEALERWNEVKPALEALSQRLEGGEAEDRLSFTPTSAPLPRTWQWLDGSTYPSHIELMCAALQVAQPPNQYPFMYQGVSDRFFGPNEDVPFISEADQIDFEGEFAVIVDDVPIGVSAEEAEKHIALVVQINDWSLRGHAHLELAAGFGWLHAKPPCSMAPVAVTPDELGEAWKNGRVALDLEVDWNGERFGAANGYPMRFSFPEMIAYAAQSRSLSAGTIIGGGTISNENFREVGSSCIGERRGMELLDQGAPQTPYMQFGDNLRMEARGLNGLPMFGAIETRVVQA